jgi:hypothetical protein
MRQGFRRRWRTVAGWVHLRPANVAYATRVIPSREWDDACVELAAPTSYYAASAIHCQPLTQTRRHRDSRATSRSSFLNLVEIALLIDAPSIFLQRHGLRYSNVRDVNRFVGWR